MGSASIAPRSDGALSVEEIRDPLGFHALADEWNALVRRSDDQLFYRHEFISLWLRHFAPHARLRVLLLRSGGELQAALPLIERSSRLYGIRLRELRSPANVHSCRFDMLAHDPRLAAEAFLDHLLRTPDWDLLRLGDVPIGGAAGALMTAAAARGLPCARRATIRSPFLPLPEQSEALAAAISGNLRSMLRRGQKRLRAEGPVTLERCAGGDTLAATLQAGFALENAGWKGREGTAMCQQLSTHGFYSELALVAAGLGALSLYTLRLGARPVAFQYGLEYAGRYLLLKPAYDEALAKCSPGQLAMQEIAQDCIRRGLAEIDLLGRDTPWKRSWTPRVRAHEQLLVFRDSAKTRLLCQAKFVWAPGARRLLARLRRRQTLD